MASHREGDKKSLSWKTLLLWRLLVGKEYMYLKLLTVGPLHMLQSPLCLSRTSYQCPVLAWLCLQRALLCFLHTCPESGCWMQVGQTLPGDLSLDLPSLWGRPWTDFLSQGWNAGVCHHLCDKGKGWEIEGSVNLCIAIAEAILANSCWESEDCHCRIPVTFQLKFNVYILLVLEWRGVSCLKENTC